MGKCGANFDKFYWHYKGNNYCQQHYLEAADMICTRCNKWIKDDIVVISLNSKWHEDCFSCQYPNCGRKFSDLNPFYKFNGNMYCREHYYKVSKDYCFISGEEIEDNVIECDSRKYSEENFVCSKCSKKLISKIVHSVNGQLVCDSCKNKKLLVY